MVGITNKNLWIEIDGQLKTGRVKFNVTLDLLLSALRDLKQKALARRAQLAKDQWKSSIGWLSTLVLGGYGLSKGVDMLLRPACFGEFYYKDPECKPCTYRDRCKVEKETKGQS